MTSFIVTNLFIVIPLLFTVYLAVRNHLEFRQNWYYVLACCITILLLVLDSLLSFIDGRNNYELLLLHALGRSLHYLLLPMPVLFLFLYLKHTGLSNKQVYLLWLPLIINSLLSILSLQNGWYYAISTDNKFIHGPLS